MLGEPDLSKDTQVRPYVGVGLNIFHASASAAFLGSASGTSTGIEAFVGAEMVFRAMPNFGVSGDIGFYQTGTFGGVDVGGLAIALSGHYYIK